MDSTPDGARMKVQRAVNSLIKNLGGWRAFRDEDQQKEDNDTAVEPADETEEQLTD